MRQEGLFLWNKWIDYYWLYQNSSSQRKEATGNERSSKMLF